MPDAIHSLRDFLDAGGDLAAVWPLDHLVEDLESAALLPPKARVESASRWRRYGEALLDQGQPDDLIDLAEIWGMPRVDDEPTLRSRADEARRELWRAEVHEDDELRRELVDSLPSDLRQKHDAFLDSCRHPLALEVVTMGRHWKCMVCGDAFDEWEARAMTIEARNDYGEDLIQESLTFCLACVSVATNLSA